MCAGQLGQGERADEGEAATAMGKGESRAPEEREACGHEEKRERGHPAVTPRIDHEWLDDPDKGEGKITSSSGPAYDGGAAAALGAEHHDVNAGERHECDGPEPKGGKTETCDQAGERRQTHLTRNRQLGEPGQRIKWPPHCRFFRSGLSTRRRLWLRPRLRGQRDRAGARAGA